MAAIRQRPERAPRADAVRNRRAVLEAAREVFGVRGIEAGIEEVADRAGVGVGTVYRHFPSKALLVDAVFEEILGVVKSVAERASEMEEPWAAFVVLVHEVAELTTANRGLRTVMRSRVRESEPLSAISAATSAIIEGLVRRVQETGTMRPDVGLADIRALFWAVNEVSDVAAAGAPDLWRRHVHLVLDGLRASSATPMSVPQVSSRRGRAL